MTEDAAVPPVVVLGVTDLDALAVAHGRVFPEGVLTRLGPGAVRRYYRWQLTGPHDALALGVFRRGHLVGFCIGGVFRGAMTGYLRANRWFLARAVLTRPWVVLAAGGRDRLGRAARLLARPRRRPSPELAPEPSPELAPAFGVLVVGVDPAERRGGVGRALLAALAEQARERGFDRMSLTVDPANSAATAFYQACGWRASGPGSMEKQLG